MNEAFENVLDLLAIVGGDAGPAAMPIWEWRWDETATPACQAQDTRDLADAVDAFLADAAERAPATTRLAILVVRMRDERTLAQTSVRGTLLAWRSESLRAVLGEFAPQPVAPRVLVKVVTETMLDAQTPIYLPFPTPTAPNGARSLLAQAGAVEPATAWAWLFANDATRLTADARRVLLLECARDGWDIVRALGAFDAFAFISSETA